MRFKSESNSSEMPELNLVSMMDVLMTILTFFIIISMTLTTQQGVEVTLPSADAGVSEQKAPDPLVVGLNRQGQISLGTQMISKDQLAQQIVDYLTNHPQGAVILKADSELPYKDVVKLLGAIREIGGDRVSLAINSN
jgi:biopolymer transport protein ExbD